MFLPLVGRRLRTVGIILSFGVVAVATIAGVIVCDMGIAWVGHRKAIAMLVDSVPAATAYMAVRTAEGHPPRARRWVPLDSIPVLAVCAVVAAEDPTFFQHEWFDWATQERLFRRVLGGDFSRGGSGIAQQLARNLFLSPDRTVRRKVREYTLAVLVAETLSKERQLELHLNLVEWGDGVWGIRAGSQELFGRPLDRLTPTETVFLATLLPAPARGMEFSLLPSRGSGASRVLASLWRAGWLDNATRAATTARHARIGWYTGRELPAREAIARTRGEMGREPEVASVLIGPGETWSQLCDQGRRGRW